MEMGCPFCKDVMEYELMRAKAVYPSGEPLMSSLRLEDQNRRVSGEMRM